MQTVSRRKPRFKFSRPAESIALACLLAGIGALGLQAATQITSFDPASATVGNARLLTLALTQYAQDYDERLPPTQTVGTFEAALRPYVPDPSVFVSRTTRRPFIPNPGISGRPLTALGELDTVVAFQDGPESLRTPATVAYLDGHIERGGVIQGDPELLSLQNARILAVGVIEYAQDYDEILPPTDTQAAFQAALLPYVRGRRFFVDPLNGQPFLPNPAISQKPLFRISEPQTTIVVQSAMPYPDGVPTVAYLDGHAAHGSLRAPAEEDVQNLKQIGLASIQYTQDHDAKLPPTSDYGAFEAALAPYLNDTPLFVSPDTQLPYLLNPAVSGVSLGSLANPAQTELARDAQRNADGTLNHLEVAGQVHQDFYFVAKSLAVGADDQTRLLWPSADQQASLWTLTPSGTIKNTFSAGGVAAGVSVGADNQTRILWRSRDNPGDLGFPITGAITLDTVGADGALANSTQFGPYDGWNALLLATGGDNSSQILWQRYNGTLALWTLSPDGNYLGSVPVPTLAGGTPVGLALGADGLTRLLWRTSYGDAMLWTVSQSGSVTSAVSVPAPRRDRLTALGFGPDGASRLLWSDDHGRADVLTLAANGAARSVAFALPGGGTASQIAIGKSDDMRVLWNDPDGSGQLQTLTPQGRQTSVLSLSPFL